MLGFPTAKDASVEWVSDLGRFFSDLDTTLAFSAGYVRFTLFNMTAADLSPGGSACYQSEKSFATVAPLITPPFTQSL